MAEKMSRTDIDAEMAKTSDLAVSTNPDDADDQTRFLRAGIEIYDDWQQAYDHFNIELWDNRLPDAIITRTRKKNVLGFFSPDRFQHVNGRVVAEISMNTRYLAVRDDRQSLSTLVHEMVHVWRHYHGPLNRKGERATNGYHDLKWAAEMERLGLVPYDTGAPDRNKTGYRMSHYIDKNGAFDLSCNLLLECRFQIKWADRIVRSKLPDSDPSDPDNNSTKKDQIKFTCPNCSLNAWAKPAAKIACFSCSLIMSPNPPKGI